MQATVPISQRSGSVSQDSNSAKVIHLAAVRARMFNKQAALSGLARINAINREIEPLKGITDTFEKYYQRCADCGEIRNIKTGFSLPKNDLLYNIALRRLPYSEKPCNCCTGNVHKPDHHFNDTLIERKYGRYNGAVIPAEAKTGKPSVVSTYTETFKDIYDILDSMEENERKKRAASRTAYI